MPNQTEFDQYDEDLSEAKQDEAELRDAWEYDRRSRVSNNPLDC